MSHPAGTLFVLRSGGFVGFAIRALTRSRVNHAGVCIGDGGTIEAEAAGAIRRTEHSTGVDVTYGDALLRRIEEQAPGRGQRIAEVAAGLLGRKYNFIDLVVLAWVNLRRDPTNPPAAPNCFELRVMDDSRLICSQLVDLACLGAGVHLFSDGRLPGQVTPGDLLEVLANPDWPLVIDPPS
jgi:hypothetical protein